MQKWTDEEDGVRVGPVYLMPGIAQVQAILVDGEVCVALELHTEEPLNAAQAQAFSGAIRGAMAAAIALGGAV